MEIQQLQTSLQKEIEAKQKISDDLKESQAENILKNEFVFFFFFELFRFVSFFFLEKIFD